MGMLALLFSSEPLNLRADESRADRSATATWILTTLAELTPKRIAFIELYTSALLKRPLQVRGHLERPDGLRLVRIVDFPYQERLELQQDHATLQRGQQPLTVVHYDHVPALATLHSRLLAVFAGRIDQLEKFSTVQAQGTEQAWMLLIIPHEANAGFDTLRLYGHQGRVDCLVSQPKKGHVHYTLLGDEMVKRAQSLQQEQAVATLCFHG